MTEFYRQIARTFQHCNSWWIWLISHLTKFLIEPFLSDRGVRGSSIPRGFMKTVIVAGWVDRLIIFFIRSLIESRPPPGAIQSTFTGGGATSIWEAAGAWCFNFPPSDRFIPCLTDCPNFGRVLIVHWPTVTDRLLTLHDLTSTIQHLIIR
jgi:hypothetical protein